MSIQYSLKVSVFLYLEQMNGDILAADGLILPPTSLGLFYRCSCLLFPGVCLESCCLRVHCVYLRQHLTSQRGKLCHACLNQWWPMAAHTPSCKALPTYLNLKYTRTHFVTRGLCQLMHLPLLLSLFEQFSAPKHGCDAFSDVFDQTNVMMQVASVHLIFARNPPSCLYSEGSG